ncbi:MAG TPA: ribonuclease E activity regulator RraA [Burkholderiaceae bacterium]|nr:ribonuclease E activity regulator RraA [Burkholderiaceae bacterium]
MTLSDSAEASPATTDLCDAHEALLPSGELQVLAPGYLALGQRQAFHGAAVTLKVFEDNSLVAEAVKTAGKGRVLVVDGGGSLRCALFGGNLAQAAQANAWAGVLIHGCARDAAEIDACAIGVRALALHPRRSVKRGVGERDVILNFGGVRITPGDWIYADRDGVLVARRPLHRVA